MKAAFALFVLVGIALVYPSLGDDGPGGLPTGGSAPGTQGTVCYGSAYDIGPQQKTCADGYVCVARETCYPSTNGGQVCSPNGNWYCTRA